MKKDNAEVEKHLNEIARAILKIQDIGERLDASPLNQDCIEFLVCKLTGVKRDYVNKILWSLDEIEERFLEKDWANRLEESEGELK